MTAEAGPDAAARAKLREGCLQNLGCLLLPIGGGVLLLVIQGADRIASHFVLDPATVDAAFVDLEGLFGRVAVRGGLTALLTLGLIGAAWEKSRLLGVLLTVPLAAVGTWAAYETLYQEFVAVRARDGRVTLFFHPPRPAKVMAATKVQAARSEKVPGPGEMTGFHYRLELVTADGTWVSEAIQDSSDVERAALQVTRERRAAEAAAAAVRGDDRARFEALGRLAVVHLQLAEPERSGALARELLADARRAGDGPGQAAAHCALGRVAHEAQRFPEAEEHYRVCLDLRRRHLDDDDPDLHDAFAFYRALLESTGRGEQADRVLGPRTPGSLVTELRRQGMSREEAEAHVRALIESRRK